MAGGSLLQILGPQTKGKGNVLREAAGVIPGPAPVSAKGRPKGL